MRFRRLLAPDTRRCLLAGLVGGLVAAAVLTPGPVSAQPAVTPEEYLRRYLDLRDQHGLASAHAEGVIEVRGAIQGKLQSAQTTWIVQPDSDGVPAYQLIYADDVPGFEVGMRVRALGRGLAAPGATLELLAIVSETDAAEWEAAHAPPRPATPPPPSRTTRVIVLNPSGAAAPGPAPSAPRQTQRAGAPAKQRPPRWQDPKPAATRTPSQRTTVALSSRGWDPYIRRYTQAVRYFNPRLPLQQAETIARSILAFSVHYGIDPRLIVAVIAVESGFSTTATSHKGAMGLGQLMPGTAAGLGVRNAYDPVENIWGAVRLLRGHMERFSGRPFWDQLALALASYNAGSGAVKRYGGVPPYRETQRYIVKVGQLYAQLCGLRPR